MGDTPVKGEGPSLTIERILAEAASDQELCEHLLRDRMEAVEQRGYALDETERAMLHAVPENQLRSILQSIAGTDLRPEKLPYDPEKIRLLPCEGIRPKGPRRLLLTAAVTTAALGGGALFVTAGNRPDAEPPPQAEKVESPTPGSSAPDAGPDGGGETAD